MKTHQETNVMFMDQNLIVEKFMEMNVEAILNARQAILEINVNIAHLIQQS